MRVIKYLPKMKNLKVYVDLTWRSSKTNERRICIL